MLWLALSVVLLWVFAASSFIYFLHLHKLQSRVNNSAVLSDQSLTTYLDALRVAMNGNFRMVGAALGLNPKTKDVSEVLAPEIDKSNLN